MASGNFTINFFSNYTGDHIITYTIYGCDTCSPTGPQPPITVSCTSGANCSLVIPVSYDTPSCDIVKINGFIRPDCAPEPGVFFSGQFPQDDSCKNYLIKCNNPQGYCESFNTLQICPECEEWADDACAVPPGGIGYQTDYWTTYSFVQTGPTAGFIADTQRIPTGTEFNLCYYNTNEIAQALGPDWTITLNTDTPDVDKPCCWECEKLTFTFNQNLLTSGPLVFPKIYPTIYYTACDAVCEDVPDAKCFAARNWTFTDINNSSVTLCLRKGSWTVLGATLNSDFFVGSTSGPCGIPQQYLP